MPDASAKPTPGSVTCEASRMTMLTMTTTGSVNAKFVVVSHLHYDHAGGMVDTDGRPNFPRARYVV